MLLSYHMCQGWLKIKEKRNNVCAARGDKGGCRMDCLLVTFHYISRFFTVCLRAAVWFFFLLKWNFSMPIHLLKNSWASCIKVWDSELVCFLFVWVLSVLIHKSILVLFLMTRQLESNSSLKCVFQNIYFQMKHDTFLPDNYVTIFEEYKGQWTINF